jgi:hypothetical protein
MHSVRGPKQTDTRPGNGFHQVHRTVRHRIYPCRVPLRGCFQGYWYWTLKEPLCIIICPLPTSRQFHDSPVWWDWPRSFNIAGTCQTAWGRNRCDIRTRTWIYVLVHFPSHHISWAGGDQGLFHSILISADPNKVTEHEGS